MSGPETPTAIDLDEIAANNAAVDIEVVNDIRSLLAELRRTGHVQQTYQISSSYQPLPRQQVPDSSAANTGADRGRLAIAD